MNVIRNITRSRTCHKIIQRLRSSDVYEPPYLADMIPKVPTYESLNIFLKGYDYPVLESYQKFLHKLLKNMDIEVEDCWAMPPQHLQVTKFQPKSELLESQYKLKLYNRILQILDVTSAQLPTVLRVIEASLPPGVKVQIRPHEEADEEDRYIPDKELHTLKEELDILGGPSKKK